MNTENKLVIAIAALGMCMAAAQSAHAGLVEVNIGPAAGGKVPTFSTDISGPGSDAQPFFAADVRWSPGETIAANPGWHICTIQPGRHRR